MSGHPMQLGQYLRAHRLGYRWAPRLNAFLRCRTTTDGFTLEVAPVGTVENDHGKGRRQPQHHVVWWATENDADPSLPDDLMRLVERDLAGGHPIRTLHRRFVLDYTDDGQLRR